MRYKLLKFIVFVFVALFATSCVSQRSIKSYFNPDEVRVEMNMDDFEYMGSVSVSAEYKTYGLCVKTISLNGEAYNPRQYTTTDFSLGDRTKYSKEIRKALYKVTEMYPDADYIVPTVYNKTIDHMIGGRIINETLTIKVYRFKK